MGSGRGDRNQVALWSENVARIRLLQWGPVVVTGISTWTDGVLWVCGVALQWGPVVVTGISYAWRGAENTVIWASMGSGRGESPYLN